MGNRPNIYSRYLSELKLVVTFLASHGAAKRRGCGRLLFANRCHLGFYNLKQETCISLWSFCRTTFYLHNCHMETRPSHGIEASGQLIQDSTAVKRLRICEHSNCQNQYAKDFKKRSTCLVKLKKEWQINSHY